ncbi:hypothetical protein LSAT2_017692, partial [Lamellibrachia satsuma]
RDSETKGKSGACCSEVQMGDRVLVQQKTKKLSTPFNLTPLTVDSKTGIEADDGAQYSWNTSHVRKFLEPESEKSAAIPERQKR